MELEIIEKQSYQEYKASVAKLDKNAIFHNKKKPQGLKKNSHWSLYIFLASTATYLTLLLGWQQHFNLSAFPIDSQAYSYADNHQDAYQATAEDKTTVVLAIDPIFKCGEQGYTNTPDKITSCTFAGGVTAKGYASTRFFTPRPAP